LPIRPTTTTQDTKMQQRVITVVLLIGLFFGLVTLASSTSSWRLPDNQQGYAPKQPLDYSHRLHAGELQINCQFCHTSADKSRHAGIPASSVCMKCHSVVTDSYAAMKQAKEDGEKKPPVSAELQKLYDSLGLDENLKPKTGAAPKSIPWVRVHNLPDYVYFSHQAHVSAGVTCQKCHGPVETMQRVRQTETLSMGWCVNCHREANAHGINDQPVHAATNCSTCHY